MGRSGGRGLYRVSPATSKPFHMPHCTTGAEQAMPTTPQGWHNITDRGRQFRAALKRPPRRSSTRAKDDLGSTGEGEQREAAEEEFGLNIQGRVQKESLPRAKESGKKGTRKARRRLPCTYAKMRSARLTASARLRQRPTSISIIIDCQFGAQTWERRREPHTPLLRGGGGQIET